MTGMFENIQGMPQGQLVVLYGKNSHNKSRLHLFEYKMLKQEQKPQKHPNRQPKARKNCFESGEFDHLKKGRIYKVSFKNFDERHRTQFGSDPVLKTPSLFNKENQIGWVTHGDMVVYLETARTGRLVGFLKLVVGDQIGYVYCTNEINLKRITSRMLRRMEEKNEPSNRENL